MIGEAVNEGSIAKARNIMRYYRRIGVVFRFADDGETLAIDSRFPPGSRPGLDALQTVLHEEAVTVLREEGKIAHAEKRG